ncbi:MAG: hypothetical protein QXY45_03300 [Candidatus Aenigmatarchaeota archaeon]
MTREYIFSGKITEGDDGGLDIEMTEGEILEIDYSNLYNGKETLYDDPTELLTTIEEALRIVYRRIRDEGRKFHGIMVVVADVYGREKKLPLSKPIGGLRRDLNENIIDPNQLADILYRIATSENHDGAIVIDERTRKVLGHAVLLLYSIVEMEGDEKTQNGKNGGTRTSIAEEYWRWNWVEAIYTMSEGGTTRRYRRGLGEEILPSFQNYS